jgi:hypothetical protein
MGDTVKAKNVTTTGAHPIYSLMNGKAGSDGPTVGPGKKVNKVIFLNLYFCCLDIFFCSWLLMYFFLLYISFLENRYSSKGSLVNENFGLENGFVLLNKIESSNNLK